MYGLSSWTNQLRKMSSEFVVLAAAAAADRTDKEETDPTSWTEVFSALRFLIPVLLGATSGCRKREAVLSL